MQIPDLMMLLEGAGLVAQDAPASQSTVGQPSEGLFAGLLAQLCLVLQNGTQGSLTPSEIDAGESNTLLDDKKEDPARIPTDCLQNVAPAVTAVVAESMEGNMEASKEVKAEVNTEAKTEASAEAKTEVSAGAKTEASVEAKTEANAEVNAGAKTEVSGGAKTEVSAEAYTKVDVVEGGKEVNRTTDATAQGELNVGRTEPRPQANAFASVVAGTKTSVTDRAIPLDLALPATESSSLVAEEVPVGSVVQNTDQGTVAAEVSAAQWSSRASPSSHVQFRVRPASVDSIAPSAEPEGTTLIATAPDAEVTVSQVVSDAPVKSTVVYRVLAAAQVDSSRSATMPEVTYAADLETDGTASSAQAALHTAETVPEGKSSVAEIPAGTRASPVDTMSAFAEDASGQGEQAPLNDGAYERVTHAIATRALVAGKYQAVEQTTPQEVAQDAGARSVESTEGAADATVTETVGVSAPAVAKTGQETTVAQIDTQPAQPAASQHVVEQVVKSIRYLVSEDGRTLRVRLVPESLGELRLDVTSTNGELNVRLASAHSFVREALEGHTETLRQLLVEDGIQVGKIAVTADGTANYGAQTQEQRMAGYSQTPTYRSSMSPESQTKDRDMSFGTQSAHAPHTGALNVFV